MRNALWAVVLCIVWAGCDSGPGPVPEPRYPPYPPSRGISINVLPPDSLDWGNTATWECEWNGGTAPYTTYWRFGGGAVDLGPLVSNGNSSSVSVEMNLGEEGEKYMWASVFVMDAEGISGKWSHYFALTTDLSATIPATTGNRLEILVEGGTAPYTVWLSKPDGMFSNVTELTLEGGFAVVYFNVEDHIIGGNAQCDITITDSFGFFIEEQVQVVIEPFESNDDTLYAIPLKSQVRVGEPVAVQVYTGQTAYSFQYLLGVGLTVDGDAGWSGVFDVGYFRSINSSIDGVWPDLTDSFIDQGLQWNPGNPFETRSQLDVSLTPDSGWDLPSVKGALFNTEFTFFEPGLKRIGLKGFNGVNRTFYGNLADGEERVWSVLMADELGNLHPSVVGQVDNTILVTE